MRTLVRSVFVIMAAVVVILVDRLCELGYALIVGFFRRGRRCRSFTSISCGQSSVHWNRSVNVVRKTKHTHTQNMCVFILSGLSLRYTLFDAF